LIRRATWPTGTASSTPSITATACASVEALEAYRYDAHGRRVLATSLQGLGNILSMYGQAGQLLYQQDSRSSQWRDFIYLGGSLVAERAKAFSTGAATVTYQHTDALGTPVAKTNASRVVVQRSEYEPYGKLLNRPLENGPGYTGHVTDAATQLTYMQQRYYDPRVGRFWSVDPVTAYSNGDMRFFNRYGYAFNNPYAFKDPDGRCPVCLVPLIPPAVAAAIDAAAFVGSAVIVAWAGNEAINSYNESADEGESAPLPEGLVGTQDVKSGLFGKTHDSGPLAPENDGTGNDEKDFERLTGGKSGPAPEGKGYPPGTRVGDNGISHRPATDKKGPRIDIPANGNKPAETLHYPEPPPPTEIKDN